MGRPLMPWQKFAARRLLERDAGGSWAVLRALLTVGRQAGKSTLFVAIICWWLTEHAADAGPQTVLLVSHRLDLSRKHWREVVAAIEANHPELVAGVRRATGQEELTMVDGSVFIFHAATAAAGHGYSVDLAILDELWDISEVCVTDGVEPATFARPDPLILAASTAGTADSKLMLSWRQQGLDIIDAGEPGEIAFLEWSPPEDAPYDAPETWAYSCPGLGHLSNANRLAKLCASTKRPSFERAYCNRWVATTRGWMAPHLWVPLAGELEAGPDGGVVALETALWPDTAAGLVHAWTDELGVVNVWPERVDELEDLWVYVDERPGVRVAAWTGTAATWPNPAGRPVETVGARELASLMPVVAQLVAGRRRRLRHPGSATFTEQVLAAVPGRTTTGTTLSAAASPGPIYLARALVWAAGLEALPAPARTPILR